MGGQYGGQMIDVLDVVVLYDGLHVLCGKDVQGLEGALLEISGLCAVDIGGHYPVLSEYGRQGADQFLSQLPPCPGHQYTLFVL